MVYDLAKLIEWTRNASGDRMQRTRETLVGTGEAMLTLANVGGVRLISVTVDGEAESLDGIEVNGSDLTFMRIPDIDVEVVVTYMLTRYTDDDMTSFLVDAAAALISDLPARMLVDRTAHTITVPADLVNAESQEPDAELQKLIVYKAANDIAADKANQAAESTISIRDGDTSISSSDSSRNAEAALKRIAARYEHALLRAKHSRLKGVYIGR